jgi:hypothetical protein
MQRATPKQFPNKIASFVAYFPTSKKCPSADRVCHAFHHKLTTKTPHPAHAFLKKPL